VVPVPGDVRARPTPTRRTNERSRHGRSSGSPKRRPATALTSDMCGAQKVTSSVSAIPDPTLRWNPTGRPRRPPPDYAELMEVIRGKRPGKTASGWRTAGRPKRTALGPRGATPTRHKRADEPARGGGSGRWVDWPLWGYSRHATRDGHSHVGYSCPGSPDASRPANARDLYTRSQEGV